MRAARLLTGVIVGLSLLLASCEASVPEPTVDAAVVSELAAACDGDAVSGAGILSTTAGTLPNHLLLLDSHGGWFDMSNWLPAEWMPPSVADAELVACVQEPPVEEAVQVCPYYGDDITRYRVTRSFEVVEAANGRTVASFALTGEPRACQATEDATRTAIYGVIEQDEVVAKLTSLVDRGIYVSQEEPQASDKPGPTQTAEVDGHDKPTPQPADDVQSVELRAAIAAGLVEITGTGDGLLRLGLQLTSLSDETLDVTVEPGTLLEPRARGTQRMVVTGQLEATLAPGESVAMELDVACVEMHQAQPTGDDTFRVLDTEPERDLLRLLALPDFADQPGRIVQFAVWTITSNPRRQGYTPLGTTLSIFGTGPDAEELRAVKRLFEDAGIDTDKYRALR